MYNILYRIYSFYRMFHSFIIITIAGSGRSRDLTDQSEHEDHQQRGLPRRSWEEGSYGTAAPDQRERGNCRWVYAWHVYRTQNKHFFYLFVWILYIVIPYQWCWNIWNDIFSAMVLSRVSNVVYDQCLNNMVRNKNDSLILQLRQCSDRVWRYMYVRYNRFSLGLTWFLKNIGASRQFCQTYGEATAE